jgi:hypothetical protein
MKKIKMKKKVLILLLFCLFGSLIEAQTTGTLSVSVTTSSTGGKYAPKNIVAIWVEDNSGKFVKTLLAYANTRKAYLTNWFTATHAAGKDYNITDATSGATKSSHAVRSCTWNGTDYSGKLVADGDYKIRMELTDKNSTGNYSGFTFTKGPTAQKLAPANVSSFSSISLDWSGTITGFSQETVGRNAFLVYPNPGNGTYNVHAENFNSLEVFSLSGNSVFKSQTPAIDISSRPKGIYLVSIKTRQGTVFEKIIKN